MFISTGEFPKIRSTAEMLLAWMTWSTDGVPGEPVMTTELGGIGPHPTPRSEGTVGDVDEANALRIGKRIHLDLRTLESARLIDSSMGAMASLNADGVRVGCWLLEGTPHELSKNAQSPSL